MEKNDENEPVLDLDLGDDEILPKQAPSNRNHQQGISQEQAEQQASAAAQAAASIKKLIASLPPDQAAALTQRLQVEGSLNDDTRRQLVFMGMLKPQNGDQVQATGPCKCGYKHFFDGGEYDYTFAFNTSEGPVWLAYNYSDNPYEIAQRFVDRHGLNRNTLNDHPLVNKLAEEIIKNTRDNTDHSKLTEAERLGHIAFDPYQASITVPANVRASYNKQTGQFQKTTYLTVERQREEERRRKKEEEEAERLKRERVNQQLKREEEQVQRERDAIRHQMELDRKEKEAEERRRRELAEQAAMQSPYVVTKPVLDAKGNLTYETRPIFSEAPGGGYTLADSGSHDDHQCRDPGCRDHEHHHKRHQQASSSVSAPKPQQSSGGIRTLSDFRSDSERPQHQAPAPAGRPNQGPRRGRNLLSDDLAKEEWNLPIMSLRYKLYGKERLEADLRKSGFTSNEIRGYSMIVELMGTSSSSSGGLDDDADYSDDDDLMASEPARPAWMPAPAAKPVNTLAGSSSKPSTLAPGSWAAQQLAGTSSSSSPTAAQPAPAAEPIQATPEVPKREIVVNSSEPTTNIQVQLHTGARLRVQANLTHTVQDLFDHVASHCPAPSGATFNLMTTFPKRVLDNMAQTVKEAQLQNAVVVQSVQK